MGDHMEIEGDGNHLRLVLELSGARASVNGRGGRRHAAVEVGGRLVVPAAHPAVVLQLGAARRRAARPSARRRIPLRLPVGFGGGPEVVVEERLGASEVHELDEVVQPELVVGLLAGQLEELLDPSRRARHVVRSEQRADLFGVDRTGAVDVDRLKPLEEDLLVGLGQLRRAREIGRERGGPSETRQSGAQPRRDEKEEGSRADARTSQSAPRSRPRSQSLTSDFQSKR